MDENEKIFLSKNLQNVEKREMLALTFCKDLFLESKTNNMYYNKQIKYVKCLQSFKKIQNWST